MHYVSNVKFCSRFDIKGYVTGFGNPDWARTHEAATSTAPSVLAILDAGATSVGITVMDEMAYRLESEAFDLAILESSLLVLVLQKIY